MMSVVVACLRATISAMSSASPGRRDMVLPLIDNRSETSYYNGFVHVDHELANRLRDANNIISAGPAPLSPP